MSTAPAAAAAPVSIEQFDVVRVELLNESPRNARKYFDPAKLAELVESVKQHGVVSPLLVREVRYSEHATHLEIIDGARRYRAAVAAGVSQVAAKIITCSDQEAMELGAISNLQREDIHPLDEALGFRQLIEMSGYTVAEICARLGKSETYVYQRLKLTDLIELARQMLWENQITVTMATMIAKLQPADQKRALDDRWALESQRGLQNWIERCVMLDLHSAPWKKDDAQLLPSAGSCDSCSKRTGATPALFPEVKKADTCTDPTCFAAKKAAFVELKKAQAKAKNPDVIEVSGSWRNAPAGALPREKYHEVEAKEAKGNPKAKQAVVVDGDKAGKTIWIEETKSGGYQKSAAEKEADRKKKLEDKIKVEVVDRCLDEMLSQVRTPLPDGVMRQLAKKMLDRLPKDAQKRLAKSWDVQPVKVETDYGSSFVKIEEPLREHIDGMSRESVLIAMIDIGCRSRYQGEPDHTQFAEWYPVDHETVEAAVREEFAVYDKPTKHKPAKDKPAVTPAKKAAKKAPAKNAAKKAAKKAAAKKVAKKKGGKK